MTAKETSGENNATSVVDAAIISPQSIITCAEAIGMADLPIDVARLLARDVEYRVRELVQESHKFMHHAKRQILIPDDINYALASRNMEPLYGHDTVDPPKFRPLPGMTPLFFIEDAELDFEDVLNRPLPKMPQKRRLTSTKKNLAFIRLGHWLAIEGQQPAVPQNPPVQSMDKTTSEHLAQTEAEVRPLVKHVLSKELQLYFETVCTVIARTYNEPSDSKTLSLLATDKSMPHLLPYMVQFLSETVARQLRELIVLRRVLDVTEVLLDHPDCFIEPYLHQLMPMLITCVVAKRLGAPPTADTLKEASDHWSVRDRAAGLIGRICHQYRHTYQKLVPRVTKTLVKAYLDPGRPLTTHYGALVGLAALGDEVIALMIVPNVANVMRLLNDAVQKSQAPVAAGEKQDEETLALRAATVSDAERCKVALLNIVTRWWRNKAESLVAHDTLTRDELAHVRHIIMDAFGDSAVPYFELKGK